MTLARIVGVGQPFAGDDGAGLAVIELLRQLDLPAGVSVAAVREPTALLPFLDEAGTRLVIVDAVLAEPVGKVFDLDGARVEAGDLTSVSSHGVSVGEVLALARACHPGNELAVEVRVVAVAISRPPRGQVGLSAAVAASVSPAARLALERATQ